MADCMRHFDFYEFFAGGGMVRQALGNSWNCVFANDFDGKKALTYQDNWGTGGELFVGDIKNVNCAHLSSPAHLAWASFPCQDLSLAGNCRGFSGNRSTHYFDFWQKITNLTESAPFPPIVVVENVCGTLTSNKGQDFLALISMFVENGYSVGALIVDAQLFVPQSRKRLFVIGVRQNLSVDPAFVTSQPAPEFHTTSLVRAFNTLPNQLKDKWLWFNVAKPSHRKEELLDILEPDCEVEWDAAEKTKNLLEIMTPLNFKKVQSAVRLNARTVGAVFKRTRPSSSGRTVRAEIRFDGLAGCLRTPNGGSSRQTILMIDGEDIRSRLISPRETARLMGLPDSYKLPRNKNSALHLTGDGVVVPVVEHLKNQIFEPILRQHFEEHNSETTFLNQMNG